MTIAVTNLSKNVIGSGASASPSLSSSPIAIQFFKVQMDSSYPTGGEALDFTNHGFKTVLAVIPAGTGSDSTTAVGAWGAAYDHAAKKLQIYGGATTASAAFNEAPTTTDLHKLFVYLVVFGYTR